MKSSLRRCRPTPLFSARCSRSCRKATIAAILASPAGASMARSTEERCLRPPPTRFRSCRCRSMRSRSARSRRARARSRRGALRKCVPCQIRRRGACRRFSLRESANVSRANQTALSNRRSELLGTASPRLRWRLQAHRQAETPSTRCRPASGRKSWTIFHRLDRRGRPFHSVSCRRRARRCEKRSRRSPVPAPYRSASYRNRGDGTPCRRFRCRKSDRHSALRYA